MWIGTNPGFMTSRWLASARPNSALVMRGSIRRTLYSGKAAGSGDICVGQGQDQDEEPHLLLYSVHAPDSGFWGGFESMNSCILSGLDYERERIGFRLI